jgi:DNA polymerase III subunit alpha
MKNYIPLHVHSHYSLLDGLSKPKQIARRCKKIGVKSCAITDHGSISGAVQIHQTLKSSGIKPILGCELYLSFDDSNIKTPENSKLTHFLVLAKNLEGWKNLIKIVSESNNPNNYYRKPRLSIDKLQEVVKGKNLIAFCGHMGSYIPDIIKNNPDNYKKLCLSFVDQMKDIFGKNNFFLETQLMDQEYMPKQLELTETIRKIASITNTKVICTPDAHYSEQEDATDQRILLCNNIKTTLTDINKKMLDGQDVPFSCFFKSDKYYILSPEEMAELHTEEEIENTQLIDSMCEDYEILHKPLLPPFKCPNGQNPDEYLRELCRNGWRDKIANVVPKDEHVRYTERIKQELSVLQGADLSSYFLIVADIVDRVRSQNWLPGPGRGSAAGCLVSYLIGITSIDPMKYDLIFERFYNSGRNTEGRVSMPDIDVDVPINKREDIISYIREKYGENKVSQMITFNTMKGRGALKEVLRVYGNISFDEMNQITKCIPDEAKIADELQEMKDDYGEASIIRWALENNTDRLKEWCSVSKDGNRLKGPLAKRFEQAIRLEGTKSNQSKHAAGVVISSHNLDTMCPMIYDTKNKTTIAGMEMQDLESLGIIKFDILGVAMLDKVMSISDTLSHGE